MVLPRIFCLGKGDYLHVRNSGLVPKFTPIGECPWLLKEFVLNQKNDVTFPLAWKILSGRSTQDDLS